VFSVCISVYSVTYLTIAEIPEEIFYKQMKITELIKPSSLMLETFVAGKFDSLKVVSVIIVLYRVMPCSLVDI
jgi:hypothetical protein